MILKTKDELFIEDDYTHEFIVPHKHRSDFVFDDWSGMTQEELQKVINKALERNCGLIEIYLQSKKNG